MYIFNYKNKKIQINNLNINQYPEETLIETIISKIEEANKLTKKEIEELNEKSNYEIMLGLNVA
jgi:hypothetical protein